MHFLQSRAERVAAHIREGIQKREWTDPLPSTREWARKLGVSPPTLCQALAMLKREGLIHIERRQGMHLGRAAEKPGRRRAFRLARMVYYGVDYQESLPGFLPWLGPLSAMLQKHGIQLSREKCSDERLRQLCSRRPDRHGHPGELLLPVSVPGKFQQMLGASKRPALHLGYTASGVELPSVVCDFIGAIRHAAHFLLRRELTKLSLVLGKVHGPGITTMQEAFVTTCREWPHQPIHAELLLVPLKPDEERIALRRFADRIKARQGILILPPLSVGLLVTTLLRKSVAIAENVQTMVIGSNAESVCVDPQPIHYPFPIDAFVKTITNAVVHFFENGMLVPGGKVVPMEVVVPPNES